MSLALWVGKMYLMCRFLMVAGRLAKRGIQGWWFCWLIFVLFGGEGDGSLLAGGFGVSLVEKWGRREAGIIRR